MARAAKKRAGAVAGLLSMLLRSGFNASLLYPSVYCNMGASFTLHTTYLVINKFYIILNLVLKI